MFKRNLFFWLDRLQISPSERILISFFFAVLVILSTVRLYWQPAFVYNEEYYEPIEAEFKRLSLIREHEEAALLAQYYPPSDTGTKEPGVPLVPIKDNTVEPVASSNQDSVVSRLASLKVNINTATREQLTQLPGIGPVIADRIVAYREKFGEFEIIEQVMQVRGIGPARLKQIKPFLELKI
ncbi:MAG: helix-hairpin-helix domain-containing protein [Balneolales bacterium]